MLILLTLVVFAGGLAAVGQELAPPPRPVLTFHQRMARGPADERAAREAFAAKQYREALDHYTRWEPSSWCGTCLHSMQGERFYHIALCHAFLGDHPAAARACLDAFGRSGWSRSEVTVLLYQLYRDAGQSDDLRRMLPQLASGAPLREMFRIADLGAKNDIEELTAIAQDSRSVHTFPYEPHTDWQCQAAAEALAACGDDAARLILVTLPKTQKSRSWLIYALGKSKSPKALEHLEELVRVEHGWDNGNVMYALSMKGEAGRKVMERVAADESHASRTEAAKWLKGIPEVPRPSKPKLGSLPKAVP